MLDRVCSKSGNLLHVLNSAQRIAIVDKPLACKSSCTCSVSLEHPCRKHNLLQQGYAITYAVRDEVEALQDLQELHSCLNLDLTSWST